MNSRILNVLEFDQVKQQLAPYLVTDQGKKTLTKLFPLTNPSKITQRLAETSDAQKIQRLRGGIPIPKLENIEPHLKRIQIGADLNGVEIAQITRVLSTTSEVTRFFAELAELDIELTRAYTFNEELVVLPELTKRFKQAIEDDGRVTDDASEELRQLRQQIRRNEKVIRETFDGLIRGNNTKYLSDAIVTIRNERYVIPVKQEYRGIFGGVVHDQSASGQTVFVEPKQIVSLNNKLRQSQLAEKNEILRILAELSAELVPYQKEIHHNAYILGQFDFMNAKAQYAKQLNATIPTVSEKNEVVFLSARHPLIDQTHVVPNDIVIGKEYQAIVITGPNTGGKTITLKTLGLLQLMGQAGLAIPVAEESQMGIFSQIFADIGDEQSIEQSLSTFSSHMTNIVEILAAADKDSLVLVDELGAGTDPQEGASLAIAILEHLRLMEIKTMATTHYPELKAYGIETEFVENASMEFDTETLSPTYHFMQGVPGRSNAFEIARRLGLAEIIVNEAERLTDSDTDVNRIIERLEEQTHESRKRLDHIKEVEQDNLKFNRAVKKLYNEFSHAKDKELEKARAKAQEIVDKAMTESEEILKNLHDRASLKPHEVIEAKSQLKKLAPEVDLSKNKVLKKAKKLRAPRVGDDIVVTAYGQRGTLVNQGKNGKWEVQVGLIKMTLKEDEFTLVKVQEEAQKPKKKQVNVVKKSKKSAGPRARLDLRGKRYEEAMQELDEFIDQALLNNMAQVDIIHGIGTGVIREGVTKYLRRNKHVKSFGYAPQNAGGSGCTIANLG